jgi:hypothetical protein
LCAPIAWSTLSVLPSKPCRSPHHPIPTLSLLAIKMNTILAELGSLVLQHEETVKALTEEKRVGERVKTALAAERLRVEELELALQELKLSRDECQEQKQALQQEVVDHQTVWHQLIRNSASTLGHTAETTDGVLAGAHVSCVSCCLQELA